MLQTLVNLRFITVPVLLGSQSEFSRAFCVKYCHYCSDFLFLCLTIIASIYLPWPECRQLEPSTGRRLRPRQTPSLILVRFPKHHPDPRAWVLGGGGGSGLQGGGWHQLGLHGGGHSLQDVFHRSEQTLLVHFRSVTNIHLNCD